MKCIRLHMEVRGIMSYVYRVGEEKHLTDEQLRDFKKLISPFVASVDPICIILYFIEDYKWVEEIITYKGYDIIDIRVIERNEKLDLLLDETV